MNETGYEVSEGKERRSSRFLLSSFLNLASRSPFFPPVVTLVVPLSLPSFLRCLRRDCKDRKGMEGHDGRPE